MQVQLAAFAQDSSFSSSNTYHPCSRRLTSMGVACCLEFSVSNIGSCRAASSELIQGLREGNMTRLWSISTRSQNSHRGCSNHPLCWLYTSDKRCKKFAEQVICRSRVEEVRSRLRTWKRRTLCTLPRIKRDLFCLQARSVSEPFSDIVAMMF